MVQADLIFKHMKLMNSLIPKRFKKRGWGFNSSFEVKTALPWVLTGKFTTNLTAIGLGVSKTRTEYLHFLHS